MTNKELDFFLRWTSCGSKELSFKQRANILWPCLYGTHGGMKKKKLPHICKQLLRKDVSVQGRTALTEGQKQLLWNESTLLLLKGMEGWLPRRWPVADVLYEVSNGLLQCRAKKINVVHWKVKFKETQFSKDLTCRIKCPWPTVGMRQQHCTSTNPPNDSSQSKALDEVCRLDSSRGPGQWKIKHECWMSSMMGDVGGRYDLRYRLNGLKKITFFAPRGFWVLH